jgi:hypothetical protein
MLERKRQEPTDDLAYAKPAIPESESWTLLRLRVPLTAYQSQSRHYWCFKNPQKDAGDQQSGVVSGSRRTSRRYTP